MASTSKASEAESRPGTSARDLTEAHRKLETAVHLTVGQICEVTGSKNGVVFSKEVIGAITNLALNQSQIFARDLEQFSRHAKRSTINNDDVKLLVRRNECLSRRLDTVIGQLHSDGVGKVAKKRKRIQIDEDASISVGQPDVASDM